MSRQKGLKEKKRCSTNGELLTCWTIAAPKRFDYVPIIKSSFLMWFIMLLIWNSITKKYSEILRERKMNKVKNKKKLGFWFSIKNWDKTMT